MRFIVEFGFDAKEGKSQELQAWLTDNEEKLAADAPAGCKYLGTYVTVQTSEKKAGSWRQLWQLDSYGAQDAFAEAMKQGGNFARLFEEQTDLIDQRNDANWSSVLMKKATDAAIWGE